MTCTPMIAVTISHQMLAPQVIASACTMLEILFIQRRFTYLGLQ
jgi:hypothetical protein